MTKYINISVYQYISILVYSYISIFLYTKLYNLATLYPIVPLVSWSSLLYRGPLLITITLLILGL